MDFWQSMVTVDGNSFGSLSRYANSFICIILSNNIFK